MKEEKWSKVMPKATRKEAPVGSSHKTGMGGKAVGPGSLPKASTHGSFNHERMAKLEKKGKK